MLAGLVAVDLYTVVVRLQTMRKDMRKTGLWSCSTSQFSAKAASRVLMATATKASFRLVFDMETLNYYHNVVGSFEMVALPRGS